MILETLFTSKTKRDILVLLFLNPDREYYIRELARLLNQQPGLVRNELVKLEKAGLVRCRQKSNSIFYQVNKDCTIYPDLKKIIVKLFAFGSVLKKILSFSQIKFAFVYGSFARGEERLGSDVDVMIIGTPPLEKLHNAVSIAEKQLNHEINYTVYPSEEFLQKAKGGFISHLLQEKKIMILGDEDELKRFVKGRPD